MTFKVECKFLKDGECISIVENEEAKEARKDGCSNESKRACCYLCSNYEKCEINCNFLGDSKNFLVCSLCDTQMVSAKASLRIGGWTGLMKLVPFGSLGEIGEEKLPVILHVCPKCGKLEFIAQKATKQKIIDRS